MKRLVVAYCFLGVSITLGIIVYFSINNLSNIIIEQAQTCLKIAQEGDSETLIEVSEEFNEIWEEIHDRFMLFTSKDNLDALEENIPSLKILAEENAVDIYCEKCMECINTLEVLKKNEKINLGNIF